MKYQIWYKRLWPLCEPNTNKAQVSDYAKRLRKAYNDTTKELIRVRVIKL